MIYDFTRHRLDLAIFWLIYREKNVLMAVIVESEVSSMLNFYIHTHLDTPYFKLRPFLVGMLCYI